MLRHLDRKAFLIDGLGGMFTEQLNGGTERCGGRRKLLALRVKLSSWLNLAPSARRDRLRLPTASARSRPSAMSALWYVKRRLTVSAPRWPLCLAQTLAVSLALNSSKEPQTQQNLA